MSNPPSKDRLYELYWGEHKGFRAIGSRYDVSREAVRQWFQQYGIQRAQKGNQPKYVFCQLSKHHLYELYWGQHLSTAAIAERYNISRTIVRNQFTHLGIPYETQDNHDAWLFSMRSRDHLYELYWGDAVSHREIAEQYNVSRRLVSRVFQRNNIPQEPDRPPQFVGESIPQKYEWPDDHPNDDGTHPQDQPLPEDPDPSKYIETDRVDYDKDRLYELYWGLGLSVEHIAAREGIGDDAVRRALRRFGIPDRLWSDHTEWEPHHGVPPKFQWPPEEEWSETDAQATSDYNGATWRSPPTDEITANGVSTPAKRSGD